MALRKPTAAAAAVNRLVREQAADVDAFLAAAAALRDAQLKETGTWSKRPNVSGSCSRASCVAAATKSDRACEPPPSTRRRHDSSARAASRAHWSRAVSERCSTRQNGQLGNPRKIGRPKPKKPDDRAARNKLREATQALAAAQASTMRPTAKRCSTDARIACRSRRVDACTA